MLTVLSVAYPLAPVGPDGVGGAEQILSALDAALVAAGHRSIVIACEGSTLAGELVALPRPAGPLTVETKHLAHAACRTAIGEVLAREHVDIVHMHGIDFHAYLPPPGPPALVTLHLPLEWYPAHVFALDRPHTYLHCVSQAQHRTAPAGAQLLAPIENGVDLAQLRPTETHGEHAVSLGRICPEKGQHLALDAATRAGIPLVLAGKAFAYPEHRAYFHEQLEPRLRAPHRFVGAVAGEPKRQLLANAACLVVSSLAAETSSLVAMEALACGTPVVAFRRGALPDLIEHGVTGLVVDEVGNVEALAAALARVPRLDRARCRRAAEQHCSQDQMRDRYLARYRELADRATRRTTAPQVHAEVLDLPALGAIEGAWRELADRAPSATVFQRPEWCLPWCEHLLDGDVQAIAVWRGTSLRALLPLFAWRDGTARVLSLIGAGVSDYEDLLIADDDNAEILAIVAQTLVGRLAWDRIELSELRDDSPLLALPLPATDEVTAQGPCPALTLAAGAPLPAKLRHDIEYQRRRAMRDLGYEHVRLRAEDAIDALASLHQARWTMRGEAGVLDERRTGFLRAATEKLAPAGAVLATGIRLGEDLAAVALVFLDRGGARYYLGGFAPAHERRSPGTLAIAAAIEDAAQRGAKLFDFLRGAEPYKYRFGACDHTRLRRRVASRY